MGLLDVTVHILDSSPFDIIFMQFPKEQVANAQISLGGLLKLDQWQGVNK